MSSRPGRLNLELEFSPSGHVDTCGHDISGLMP